MVCAVLWITWKAVNNSTGKSYKETLFLEVAKNLALHGKQSDSAFLKPTKSSHPPDHLPLLITSIILKLHLKEGQFCTKAIPELTVRTNYRSQRRYRRNNCSFGQGQQL